MFDVLKKKSYYLFSAVFALLISIFFDNQMALISILFFSIVGMIPMLKDVFKKMRLFKISLKLPLIITLLILIFLKNYTVSSVFLILIVVGGLFKDYILWRVEESIKSISKTLPHKVTILKGESEIVISIDDIKEDDIIIVKAGGRIPVDGLLLTQAVHFDESVVTGESKPIKKEKGDRIIAGSILFDDYSEIKAIGTAANSTISQIENLVRNSQKEQAKLSTFTTKYAFYTILFTLLVMGVFYFFTGDILQTLALWIALVPVIFAIIVPVATTIGISLLARQTILVRNAQAFENLTKINTIVFDKTGTLTEGRPDVTDIISYNGFSQKEVLEFGFSLEKFSEHPFARAVLKKGKEKKVNLLNIENFKAHKGKGVSGIYNGKQIFIGDGNFMEELHIDISMCEDDVKKYQLGGASVFFVSHDFVCSGVMVIADRLREGIKEMIDLLHRENIETIMLTGDNQVVADTIANKLSIDVVYADLSPEDKNTFIEKFQNENKKVLMVGDGINDAPALAKSDVGLAMGEHGIGLTLNSADIILPNNNILKIPFAISVAKRVFRIVKLDLWVATTIHVITAVLVVFGSINVLGSTILHQFSSFFVLINTLRIFNLKNKEE